MGVWNTPAIRLLRAAGRAYLRPLGDLHAFAKAALQRRWPSAGNTSVNLVLCVLLSGIAFGAGTLADMRPAPAPRLYHAALGEPLRERLDDGSGVQLAPLTELSVSFTASERNVALVGEAYFEIGPDPMKRPFTVTAGDVVVRDIGTKFSVRTLARGGLRVLVSEGAVDLSFRNAARKFGGSNKPQRIYAGHSALLKDGFISVLPMAPHEIEARLAWRGRRLTFQDRPLAEVVEDLNRFSTRRIVIVDPSIESASVNDSFNVDEIDKFISSLRETGVRAQVVPRGSVQEIHLFKPQEVWMQNRDPLPR